MEKTPCLWGETLVVGKIFGGGEKNPPFGPKNPFGKIVGEKPSKTPPLVGKNPFGGLEKKPPRYEREKEGEGL